MSHNIEYIWIRLLNIWDYVYLPKNGKSSAIHWTTKTIIGTRINISNINRGKAIMLSMYWIRSSNINDVGIGAT